MQPLFIVSSLIMIGFIAFSRIKGFNLGPERPNVLRRRVNHGAPPAMVFALFGFTLLSGAAFFAQTASGYEGLAGVLANGLGNLQGAMTPGAGILGAGIALGALPRDEEGLLTLKELAKLDKPFAAESAELFASVRDHDFETLAARCDDDFGIVDINTEGGSEVIRSRAEWEQWFSKLFNQLSAMKAETDTLIARYDAVDWGDTGMSVVEFAQFLKVGGKIGRYNVIVTIVWKKVEGRWIEARWHSSLVSTELPEGFGT